jgi:hypothetical protein
MPLVKKAPSILTREFHLEEPVSADHAVNSVLKKTLWRDQDCRKWREQRRAHPAGAPARNSEQAAKP